MGLTKRVTELSPEKRRLLALLMKEQNIGPALLPLSRFARSSNVLPVSFAQQRLWFLDHLEPGNLAYLVPGAFRFDGPLDLAAFGASINEVIRRHEILRTSFTDIEGEPMQVIDEPQPLVVPLIDLRCLPESVRVAEVQRLREDEAGRAFDLERAPLLRVTLLKLGEREHIVLLTMHHIVSDGWSMSVLLHEVATLYEQFTQGQSAPLPDLPIQYADYAAWQRQLLQGEVLQEQLTYWKRQLQDAPAVLELPSDRPRPPVRSSRGACISFALPGEVAEGLRILSQREGATTFMTLLAAFKVLVHRYTGQSRIVVGTSVAGRNRKELEGLIGFFVNSLVLHTDLSGAWSFRDVLARVKETALGAYAHQELPFERLVEEFQTDRSLSYTPLFQVFFSLQNAPRAKKELRSVKTETLGEQSRASKFDLSLDMMEAGNRIGGSFEYNTDLFEGDTIRRMIGHLQTILQGVVNDPDQSIAELRLLTDAETQQLLASSKRSQPVSTPRSCLHELFEVQVEKRPNAIALIFEDEQLTYCELNLRANRLAHYLRELGVGPDVRVGICVERSVEMVVGLLGILKAGGAYVPLDPAYPDERLVFMLDDSGAKTVLTQSALASRFSSADVQVLNIDFEPEWPSRRVDDNLPSRSSSDAAACLLYTSGATGEPHGVVVTHANVQHLFAATPPVYFFSQHDVWTLFHSYASDMSVWELWGALLHGGQLIVVPYPAGGAPQAVWELLCTRQVTVLSQTPAAFRQLLANVSLGDCHCLRLLVLAGETLEPQVLKPWFDVYGDQRPQLFNMYGITETTVQVTHQLMSAELCAQYSGSVIGQPLNGLQLYLLDANLQLVPQLCAGELYVGGGTLARGYNNRATLTAERFVPDPFSEVAGGRLYKSGDIARSLPDGRIEYLGRLDHQVKVHGLRIEPGEIESVLAEHPHVREAVVLASENAEREKRLTAYLVMNSDADPSAAELRRFASDKLPAQMVPASFVRLQELPLARNGKIDRAALPEVESELPAPERDQVAAQTPLEEILSGDLPVAGLPLDHARPAGWSARKETVGLIVPGEICEQLREVCGEGEALRFTALIAALKISLHLYTGMEDVTIGTAIHEEYGDVAALNKVLVLRDQVKGSLTVRQILAAVKQTLAEAYAHQKYPFEKLVQLLEIEAGVNGAAFLPVVAIFDRLNRRCNVAHLQNDLTVRFIGGAAGQGLRAEIEYRADLFERANIEIFARHYQAVLRAVVYQPDIRIEQIELLSNEQRAAMVEEFNCTERDYWPGAIHQLFEEQARRTPMKLAVVDGRHQLSYRELNQRANQLARYLQRRGVRPGERVGICLTHSTEMVVALLGVLKAGGAYVPLDPAHPAKGLAVMLADARASLLLSEMKLAGPLAGLQTSPTFLDAEAAEVEQEETEDLPGSVTGEDLAYVIYTSGSTGEPKGVMIRHASLVNYSCWANEVYVRKRARNFALYTSLAFDLTVTSIFTPLISGNRIHIYQPQEQASALPEILADEQVEVLKLTPSHLSLIKDRDNRGSRVQVLIAGGEVLETGLARRIHESFGGQVEIFNEYGPTEATVGCMLYKYAPEKDRREFVPIGGPAANTQIYVLDQNLRPVAENIIGELCISGAGLAVGYLNQEGLTKAKFVDHPFIAGGKLYRSGDRARWLAEGQLEYLGRNDEQVKFHGHRVELNHLRSTLNRHPQVRDSVVVMVKDGQGSNVMLAYYVARQALEASELRDFLSAQVVKETVPNFFVHLRRLPLSLNGKVNQQALPTLAQVKESLKREFVEPRTETERQLAKAWMQILGLARVGIHENFFELGGHSLLATRVLARVRETFDVEIPLRSLFESPTIAAMAEQVELAIATNSGLLKPPIERVPRAGPLPISYFLERRLQRALWAKENSVFIRAQNIHYAVHWSGPLNYNAFEQSVNEIIRRHEILRTNFDLVDGEPVQFISEKRTMTAPLIDLRHLDPEARQAEAVRLATHEVKQRFDPSRDLLLRLTLFQVAEDEYIVVFVTDHLVCDGWSMDVIFTELAALYDAFAKGMPSPLAELPFQYADYSHWQRNWLQGEVLENLLSYWKKQFAGHTPFPEFELPAARPRPAIQDFAGAARAIPFSVDLTNAIKSLSRRQGVTIFMMFLAGLKVLLHRHSGRESIGVLSPTANRAPVQTEGLIGWFAQLLILRTDMSGDPSFSQLLERVRETTLGAFTHQDIPLPLLLKELSPTPWSQAANKVIPHVFFNLDNYLKETPVEEARKAPAISDVNIRQVNIDTSSSEACLSIDIKEHASVFGVLINYETSIYDAETINEWLEHFESLMEAAVANPQLRLSQLPLLTRAQRNARSPAAPLLS
jgi:amino acid adenylation domain-containing protein